MKYSISVVVTALLASLFLVEGIKNIPKGANKEDGESLSNIQLRNRGIRNRGLRHGRELKSGKKAGKTGKNKSKSKSNGGIGLPGLDRADRGFTFEKQKDVFEMYQCDAFTSDTAQRALNHPNADERCLNNSCPNGCCRRYYWLVCDEKDQFPWARCICNANTNNSGDFTNNGSNNGSSSINIDVTFPSMNPGTNNVPAVTDPSLVINPSSALGIISRTPSLSTLQSYIVRAGLANYLNGQVPFTIFAPTNEAFATVPGDIMNFLLASGNNDWLQQVLTYHVVRGKVSTLNSETFSSVQGQNLKVNTNPTLSIQGVGGGGANIGTKLESTTSAVYTIDGVLIQDFVLAQIIGGDPITITTPPPAPTPINMPINMPGTTNGSGGNSGTLINISNEVPSLSTFVNLAMNVNLEQILNSYGPSANTVTFFAPTNEAFAKLPTNIFVYLLDKQNNDVLSDILLYHTILGNVLSTGPIMGTSNIVSLQGQTIEVSYNPLSANGVNVINGNNGSVRIGNYIINPISEVLIPDNVLPQESLPEEEVAKPTKSIMEITNENPTLFSKFDDFVNQAGLTLTLMKSPGPFTVFVPTNDAFDKLPTYLSSFLMADENKDTLSKLLSYHIFAHGKVPSPIASTTVNSYQGESVSIMVLPQQNKVMVNNVNIIGTTEGATNGKIYVIDEVLIPDSIQIELMYAEQETMTMENNSNSTPDRGNSEATQRQQGTTTSSATTTATTSSANLATCENGKSKLNPYYDTKETLCNNSDSDCDTEKGECCLATYCICGIPGETHTCVA